MKSLKSFIIIGISLSFIGLIGLGCGGSSGNDFIITPSETTVAKGNTQQFTAETSSPVTWSVDGGDTNGTIDANGVYTPPAVLPLDPQVTIRAQDQNGGTATVIVNLRTGDILSFGAVEQVNDSALDLSFQVLLELQAGVSDRVAARVGSLEVDAVWTQSNGSKQSVFFDQNRDLLGFGTDLEVVGSSNEDYAPSSLVLDSNLNPGVIITQGLTGTPRVFYGASQDQGASFLPLVPIDPSDPSVSQHVATARVDGQDRIHVAYSHDLNPRYVQSSDQGQTWSQPISLGSPPSSSSQAFPTPSIAVSEDGQTIYICYTEEATTIFSSNIHVVKSSDGGSSFGSPLQLTSSGKSSACRIALGSQGQVYVSYIDNDSGSFIKSEDGGATFSNAIQIGGPNHMGLNFLMSVDSLDRIDIVWSADTDNDTQPDGLFYVRSIDQGDSFSTELMIHGGVGQTIALPMGLVHDISGRLHLLYLSDINDPNANYDIFYQAAE